MTIGELYKRTRPVEYVVAAGCAYEATAICWPAHKLPTISALQRRHRVIGVIVAAWLMYHFVRYPQEVTDDATRCR